MRGESEERLFNLSYRNLTHLLALTLMAIIALS